MELILGIGLIALFGKKIMGTLKSTAIFFTILIMSIVLTFSYSIPYISSLAICILLRYSIKDVLISTKNLSKSLVISKYRFEYYSIQKTVNILINCNITAFIILSNIFVISELINPYLTVSRLEIMTVGIIVIGINRILRIVIDRFLRKRLFVY